MRMTVMPSPPVRLQSVRLVAPSGFNVAPPGSFLPANSGVKGGTVNRPCTHVSHRKQTAEHKQGRNVPVHAFSRYSSASKVPRA